MRRDLRIEEEFLSRRLGSSSQRGRKETRKCVIMAPKRRDLLKKEMAYSAGH